MEEGGLGVSKVGMMGNVLILFSSTLGPQLTGLESSNVFSNSEPECL